MHYFIINFIIKSPINYLNEPNLLDQFLIDAKNDKRLRSVRLMAAINCESALALFSKVGFEKYGLEKDSIREGEKYYDQVYMQIDCR